MGLLHICLCTIRSTTDFSKCNCSMNSFVSKKTKINKNTTRYSMSIESAPLTVLVGKILL